MNCLLLVLALCLSSAAPLLAQVVYQEDFSTREFMDAANTEALWDTVQGVLRLPHDLDIVGTFTTADEARHVVVDGDYAFVACHGAGLQVVDIMFPDAPSIAGGLDTPGDALWVAVTGDLLLLADGTSGLLTIDITDPENPVLLGTRNTPGTARAVTYAGDLAFVADGTAGLIVIDLSDPTNPQQIGSLNTPGDARSLQVVGDRIFMAGYGSGLQIIDISDPTAPTMEGTLNTSGNARDLLVWGEVVYIADDTAGLQVVDIDNPASPTLLASLALEGNCRGLGLSGDRLYIACASEGLVVVDVSNPTQPLYCGERNTSGAPWSMAIDGAHLYLADHSGGLRTIEIMEFQTPEPHGIFAGGFDGLMYMDTQGDLVCCTSDGGSFHIFDISDPGGPLLLSSVVEPGGNFFDLVIDGTYLYTTYDWGIGLRIYDISDPGHPYLVGESTGWSFEAYILAKSGDHVFLPHTNGLGVVDVSDPLHPEVVAGDVEGSREMWQAEIRGDYLYWGESLSLHGDVLYSVNWPGVHVYDISDPLDPVETAFVYEDVESGLTIFDISDPALPVYERTVPAYGTAMARSGDRLYTLQAGRLYSIDVNNPRFPVVLGYTDLGPAGGMILDLIAWGDHLLAMDHDSFHTLRIGITPLDHHQEEVQSVDVVNLPDISQYRLDPVETGPNVWEVSLDGGGTWLESLVGIEHQVVPPADQLRWRVNLNGTDEDPPDVSQLTITFESATGLPAAPDHIQFSSSTCSEIEVTWDDNSVNEDGFRIYHALEEEGYYSVAGETTADQESFTCRFLAADTLHWFYVVAFNESGESDHGSSSEEYTEPNDPTVHLVQADGLGEFPTIQAALDACCTGDTVELADGIYQGDGNRDLTFNGLDLVVRSASDDPESCVIDCQGSEVSNHRGFYLVDGETAASRISGIKIINGYFESHGGGIYCSSSNPTIVNCAIEACISRRGGGICLWGSDSDVRDTVFRGNGTPQQYSWGGGGVLVLNSTATITNCTFLENFAWGPGSGIYIQASTSGQPAITISNCTFDGNGRGSGAIYSRDSNLEIDTCLLTNNGTVVGQPAVYVNGGTVLLSCCDLYGNSGDWTGNIASQLGQNGNISADPIYCDAAGGDFTLRADSPCLENNNGCGDMGAFGQGCDEGAHLHQVAADGSADYETIAEGLAVALPGDTVLVHCGTYLEHGLSLTSGVVLRSETGLADCVTIDGDGQGRVLDCLSCDETTRLEGFTITGGAVSSSGAALRCDESQLRISDCLITGNAGDNGGSVYCSDSDISLTRCDFTENTANYGGALLINGSSPEFVDCRFSDNVAVTAGGALRIQDGSSPSFNGCLFTGNQAANSGAALSCLAGSATTLTGCTVYGNSTASGTIRFSTGALGTLANCIISHSVAGSAFACTGDDVILNCCDIYGNEGGDWTSCIADQLGFDGNISADPQFCDTAGGDFTLNAGSPCSAAVSGCGQIGAFGVACDLPLTPGDLVAEAYSSSEISLSWSDLSDDETGFNIYVSPTEEGSYELCGSAAADATAFISSGLEPDTEYWHHVRAEGPGGESPPSTPAMAITEGSPVYISLFELTAQPGRVLTEWSVDESADLVAFRLTATDGEQTWNLAITSGSGNTYRAIDQSVRLAVGGEFTYSLQAQLVPDTWVVVRRETVELEAVPLVTELTGAWPNPFNPRTSIRFSLAERGSARLAIYDLSGRRIRILHDGVLDAAVHERIWRGDTDSGHHTASGVYFVRLSVAGGGQFTRRLVMIR